MDACDKTRLSLALVDLPLTPFGMSSPTKSKQKKGKFNKLSRRQNNCVMETLFESPHKCDKENHLSDRYKNINTRRKDHRKNNKELTLDDFQNFDFSNEVSARRQSTYTDIDDGSFVEFYEVQPNSAPPNYHFYYTCSEENVTQFSTSSKIPKTPVSFHKYANAHQSKFLLKDATTFTFKDEKKDFDFDESILIGSSDMRMFFKDKISKQSIYNSTLISNNSSEVKARNKFFTPSDTNAKKEKKIMPLKSTTSSDSKINKDHPSDKIQHRQIPVINIYCGKDKENSLETEDVSIASTHGKLINHNVEDDNNFQPQKSETQVISNSKTDRISKWVCNSPFKDSSFGITFFDNKSSIENVSKSNDKLEESSDLRILENSDNRLGNTIFTLGRFPEYRVDAETKATTVKRTMENLSNRNSGTKISNEIDFEERSKESPQKLLINRRHSKSLNNSNLYYTSDESDDISDIHNPINNYIQSQFIKNKINYSAEKSSENGIFHNRNNKLNKLNVEVETKVLSHNVQKLHNKICNKIEDNDALLNQIHGSNNINAFESDDLTHGEKLSYEDDKLLRSNYNNNKFISNQGIGINENVECEKMTKLNNTLLSTEEIHKSAEMNHIHGLEESLDCSLHLALTESTNDFHPQNEDKILSNNHNSFKKHEAIGHISEHYEKTYFPSLNNKELDVVDKNDPNTQKLPENSSHKYSPLSLKNGSNSDIDNGDQSNSKNIVLESSSDGIDDSNKYCKHNVTLDSSKSHIKTKYKITNTPSHSKNISTKSVILESSSDDQSSKASFIAEENSREFNVNYNKKSKLSTNPCVILSSDSDEDYNWIPLSKRLENTSPKVEQNLTSNDCHNKDLDDIVFNIKNVRISKGNQGVKGVSQNHHTFKSNKLIIKSDEKNKYISNKLSGAFGKSISRDSSNDKDIQGCSDCDLPDISLSKSPRKYVNNSPKNNSIVYANNHTNELFASENNRQNFQKPEFNNKDSSPVLQISNTDGSSSESENFEDYMTKLKLKTLSQNIKSRVYSVDSFIVSDEDEVEVSSDTSPPLYKCNIKQQKDSPCTQNFKTPKKEWRNRPQISSSDSDDDVLPVFRKKKLQPRKTNKKLHSLDGKLVKYDSDLIKDSGISSETHSFLSSLSIATPKSKVNQDAVPFVNNFQKNKDKLATKLYQMFNSKVFEHSLPEKMDIRWNPRMRKTAGFCYYQLDKSKISGRGARIELSLKVIDGPGRLRDTLLHEMCHAASWIISGYKDGHGPLWKSWAAKAMKTFPQLPPVSRCHSYEIKCKYTYKCTKCGYSIGRHSKSLDTSKKVCGLCFGSFELIVNNIKQTNSSTSPIGRTPQTPRTLSRFALFVKENYGEVKRRRVNCNGSGPLSHAQVMKILSQDFAKLKTRTA